MKTDEQTCFCLSELTSLLFAIVIILNEYKTVTLISQTSVNSIPVTDEAKTSPVFYHDWVLIAVKYYLKFPTIPLALVIHISPCSVACHHFPQVESTQVSPDSSGQRILPFPERSPPISQKSSPSLLLTLCLGERLGKDCCCCCC